MLYELNPRAVADPRIELRFDPPIVSPRRGRQRVASGEEASETRRNPRYRRHKPRGRAERAPSQRASAEATSFRGFHHGAYRRECHTCCRRVRGSLGVGAAYHGLTPMATCCRPLRGLRAGQRHLGPSISGNAVWPNANAPLLGRGTTPPQLWISRLRAATSTEPEPAAQSAQQD
jgi:hypothetical protein